MSCTRTSYFSRVFRKVKFLIVFCFFIRANEYKHPTSVNDPRECVCSTTGRILCLHDDSKTVEDPYRLRNIYPILGSCTFLNLCIRYVILYASKPVAIRLYTIFGIQIVFNVNTWTEWLMNNMLLLYLFLWYCCSSGIIRYKLYCLSTSTTAWVRFHSSHLGLAKFTIYYLFTLLL